MSRFRADVTLKIALPRGRESLAEQVPDFQGTFTCHGAKVGWKTGYVMATKASVFFWAASPVPKYRGGDTKVYRFLAAVEGASVRQCIAKFKGRYCTGRKGTRGFIGRSLRGGERERKAFTFVDRDTGERTDVNARTRQGAWQSLANACCDGDIGLAGDLFDEL
jgi:hypothetical protein